MFQSCSISHSYYRIEPFHKAALNITDSDFITSIEIDIPNGWNLNIRVTLSEYDIANALVQVYSDRNLDIGYNLYLFTMFLFEQEQAHKTKKDKLTKNKIQSFFYRWDNFPKYQKEIYKCHGKYHRMKAFL